MRRGEHTVYAERHGQWEAWFGSLPRNHAIEKAKALLIENPAVTATRVEHKRTIVRQFIRPS